ncbi:putative 2OG-Fe(II) oxygenase family oxidoreductase, partial [Podospora appendiculata]
MGSVAPPLVPTIDIAAFLADSTSEEAEDIVDAVRQACTKTGFFQITGHGFPEAVQDAMFQASKKFFALPMEEKVKLDAKTTIGYRGYDVLASQVYDTSGEVLPDLKEGFYVGHDLPLSDPVVVARRFFMGPNVWPPVSSLAAAEFQHPVEAYHGAVNSLALKMLDLVARTLPYDTKQIFAEFATGYVIAPLRLLHYPPADTDAATQTRPRTGAGAHTDMGAITLLLQNDQPGLEVLHPGTGEFVAVDPTPGAFVVNVGDMLSAWTGGLYKSSVHRVINRNPVDRYSAAFFFDGSLDCPLDPLDGSGTGPKGELTVEKHVINRIMQSY